MRALFLDAGGVITRLLRPKPQVFAEACARLGLEVSTEACTAAFAASERLLEEREELFLSKYPAFERASLEVLRSHTGLDQRLEEVLQEYMRRLQSPRLRVLYDDVLPTLERLRSSRLRLGVLSNASKELIPLLFRMGVAPYLDAIIVSELVGYAKPQREIFAQALEALDVSPEDAIHVGDSYHYDYLAARKAGLAAVLLDREGGCRRDIPKIRSLQELPALLDAL